MPLRAFACPLGFTATIPFDPFRSPPRLRSSIHVQLGVLFEAISLWKFTADASPLWTVLPCPGIHLNCLYLDYWTSSFSLPLTCSLPPFSWSPYHAVTQSSRAWFPVSCVYAAWLPIVFLVRSSCKDGSFHLPSVQAQAVSLGPALRCRLRTCSLRNALALVTASMTPA